MSEECHELQNIKYQTMLLNGSSKAKQIAPEKKDDIIKIEQFLEQEHKLNIEKPWNKLGKATKLKKLSDFVVRYSNEKKLNSTQSKQLNNYLLRCLERKKLNKQKDVVYDVKKQIIVSIPNLYLHKNKFTLKRQDKKGSSLKNLSINKNGKTIKKRSKKPSKSKIKNKTDVSDN